MAKAKIDPAAAIRAKIIANLGKTLTKRGCTIATADEATYIAPPKRYIPTGIWAFDAMLSGVHGGYPMGRFIEVSGNEGAGKTALAEFTMGVFKRSQGIMHYLDYEKSMDPAHLACYEVDLPDFIYPDLITLEDAWDYIDGVLSTTDGEGEDAVPNLFVWDSLAQSPARAEMEEDSHSDSHMSLVARAMAKAFRKHTRRFSNSSSTVMFVNQVRDKPGAAKFGPQTDTPGGRAAKFAYAIRLKVAKVETLKRGDVPVGHLIEVTSTKNKHAPYPQKVRLYLSYSRGIDVARSNLLWLESIDYVEAAGKAGLKFAKKAGELAKLAPFKRSAFAAICEEHREAIADLAKAAVAEQLASLRVDDAGEKTDD